MQHVHDNIHLNISTQYLHCTLYDITSKKIKRARYNQARSSDTTKAMTTAVCVLDLGTENLDNGNGVDGRFGN